MTIRLARLSVLGLFLVCLTVAPSGISALDEEDDTDMDEDAWLQRTKREAGGYYGNNTSWRPKNNMSGPMIKPSHEGGSSHDGNRGNRRESYERERDRQGGYGREDRNGDYRNGGNRNDDRDKGGRGGKNEDRDDSKWEGHQSGYNGKDYDKKGGDGGGPKKDNSKCQDKKAFFRKCVKKLLKCMAMERDTPCCTPADPSLLPGLAAQTRTATPCPTPSPVQVIIRAMVKAMPGDDDAETGGSGGTDANGDPMDDDVHMMCRAVIKNGCGGGGGGQASSCPAKTYRVEGIVSDPYLTATDANGMNSGFIPDVLQAMKMASQGWFDYTLTVQPENTYGDSVNGVNTGLIADLVNDKTDLAAADLTVKRSRHAVIDFIQPFLTTQTRILVNNANGDVGDNPTFYVAGFVSVAGVLMNSQNATLNNIYSDAVAANRILDDDTGIATLLASNTAAAYISETPSVRQAAQNNPGRLSLTDDILATAFLAFGLQQNQNDFRLCLNDLLLTLQESGQLQALLDKYGLS